MEARKLVAKEVVPASRKLGAEDAAKLLAGMKQLVVAKGAKWEAIPLPAKDGKAAVEAMLGPTGNLRAPTARAGKTILVGFNEDAWSSVLA